MRRRSKEGEEKGVRSTRNLRENHIIRRNMDMSGRRTMRNLKSFRKGHDELVHLSANLMKGVKEK